MGVWYLTKSDTHTARQVNYVVKGGKLWKDGEKVPGSATGTCVWVKWVGLVVGTGSVCPGAASIPIYINHVPYPTVVNNYLRNGYLWDNVRVMGEWRDYMGVDWGMEDGRC